MAIKQLSIFIENKMGRLAEVTEYLAQENINIHALSIADTTDFGILRLIVKDAERAKDVLRSHGLTVRTTDVVAVGLAHTPGSLAKVLRTMENINISIEYMYAFTSRSPAYDAMVILRLENQEQILDKIIAAQVNLLDEDIMQHLEDERGQ